MVYICLKIVSLLSLNARFPYSGTNYVVCPCGSGCVLFVKVYHSTWAMRFQKTSARQVFVSACFSVYQDIIFSHIHAYLDVIHDDNGLIFCVIKPQFKNMAI